MKIPEITLPKLQLDNTAPEISGTSCANEKGTGPVRACPGMTQENYVNTLSIGMVMASSIAAMSFAGAWV